MSSWVRVGFCDISTKPSFKSMTIGRGGVKKIVRNYVTSFMVDPNVDKYVIAAQTTKVSETMAYFCLPVGQQSCSDDDRAKAKKVFSDFNHFASFSHLISYKSHFFIRLL